MSPSQSDHKPVPAPLPVPNPSKSFWHSEPSEFLLGHRTTEELPEYADAVIVGSGITGASAAKYLAEEHVNWKVVMLEAREACWGATGRVSRAAFSEWRQSTCFLGVTLPLLTSLPSAPLYPLIFLIDVDNFSPGMICIPL
jgi:hypothetical protein